MRETITVASAIELWTIPLGVSRSALLLSEDEAARAARFKFDKDRISWTNARSALRTVLSICLGEPPESLRFVCNKNGKPALDGPAGIEFNLSHAGDFALIAVSACGPVGVDIERIRPEVEIAALLARIGEADLPEDMAGLYQRWAQREARVKAIGGQLFQPPPPEVRAIDLTAPAGYVAAVATAKTSVSLTFRSLND